MKNKPRAYKIIMLMTLTLLLTACNERVEDLKKHIATLKQAPPPAAKNPIIPISKPPIPAVYQASGQRTPFDLTETMATDKNGNSHPLQAYPLATLRFMGTLSHDNATAAYILTPDNKVYQVKKGDILGSRHGNIINIEINHIDVMENDVDDAKRPVQRIVTLQLKD